MGPLSLIALCLILRGTSASLADELPEPQNVHFHSVNLQNTVRWTPGPGSPNDTVYTVEYAIYGDADSSGNQVLWKPVDHCRSITHSPCDVSQETSNLSKQYYARVRAGSGHRWSVWSENEIRFNPLSDTILGAPQVLMTVTENYVNVTMKGPFRWKTEKKKKEKSLWKIFPDLMYNVTVWQSRRNYTTTHLIQSMSLTLGPMEPSTEVCVQVQAQSEYIPLACRPSNRLCIQTPKDSFREQLLVAMLGGVLPSALCLCVITILGGLIHCYITDHRQKMPKSTASSAEEAVNVEPERVCYAQQQQDVSPAAPPAAPQEEDSISQSSESQLWPQDYGIVVPDTFQAPCQSEPYMTQSQTTPPQDALQDSEEEEPQQIFLDWSPETQQLKIPLMGLLGLEDEAQIQSEAVSLLPNVILRQSSEEGPEPEDHFTKIERDWGLVINSSSE